MKQNCPTAFLILVFIVTVYSAECQLLKSIELSGLNILSIKSFNSTFKPDYNLPVFSFQVNEKTFFSDDKNYGSYIEIQLVKKEYSPGLKYEIIFRNISSDTLLLHNIVPFGQSQKHVYITGKGNHGLSRSHMFIPGYAPVNVILPDNAWELGFSAVQTSDTLQICALTRRIRESVENGRRRRFETELFPGGLVKYNLWADSYTGPWQNGLKLMFQKRLLYDIEPGKFDNSLFERADLKWIRHTYAAHLIQNWDNIFYDYTDGKFHLEDFVKRNQRFFGGDDFIGIWPTWPTLGLDQRNQWDLFRDLPGGMKKIKDLSQMLRKNNSHLFVCYNPWDESTRSENQIWGIAQIIKQTESDGVVLDTRGESSKELQLAADSVRPGVVMYSEGMAVPRDMQGIVAGRVHNALYYCPMLNLNKFIKPGFAIFRVAELFKEPIRREFNVAFFNGYGTEMNIFAPGKPEWADEQYRYWGKTLRILRENSLNFVSDHYTPLIPVTRDSIWVNQWIYGDKVIYTIYSAIPEGFKDYLFEVLPKPDFHFVDLWNHQLIEPKLKKGKWLIEAETEAFHKKWLGTNNEGAVGCMAQLPEILKVSRESDILQIESQMGDEIRIWAGLPDYEREPLRLSPGNHAIRLYDHFGRFEGKFVVQLFEKGILLDEQIEEIKPGTPRLASISEKTEPLKHIPSDMVKIPSGKFIFKSTHGDEFIPYPKDFEGKEFQFQTFLMDKHPVTNIQFKKFMEEANYIPKDTSNFLKHWKNGQIPRGMEYFPVIYVSYEDAQAYAKWAGKRLPSETEWQYAAQTSSENEWPWAQKKPVKRVLQEVTGTLTVSQIEGIDPKHCNLGDGNLYPVGKYSKGTNPYGLEDLVGCVWQLTNDIYFNGSYRYIILKGGSVFKPSSSWWYVQGGPRELHYRQQLLRVSEGFERNATVGFRCIKDF